MKTLITAIIVSIVATVSAQAEFIRINPNAKWGFDNAKEVHKEYTTFFENDKDSVRVIELKSGTYVIIINGEINNKLVSTMTEMLPEIHEANRSRTNTSYAVSVFMHSGGGFMKSGIALGELFKKEQVSVKVDNLSMCASACALAWTGGLYRSISGNGKLIFHAPYTTGKFGTKRCSSKEETPELVAYIEDTFISPAKRNSVMHGAYYCDPNGGKTHVDGSILETK